MEGNKTESVTNSRSLFGKRFTGGFAYGIGVEYGRFLIGGTGRVGCTSWNHSEGFIDVAFEIGYRSEIIDHEKGVFHNSLQITQNDF